MRVDALRLGNLSAAAPLTFLDPTSLQKRGFTHVVPGFFDPG